MTLTLLNGFAHTFSNTVVAIIIIAFVSVVALNAMMIIKPCYQHFPIMS